MMFRSFHFRAHISAFILVAGLLYLLVGILPSAFHKPTGTSSGFHPESCYGADSCGERVQCIEDNTQALVWRIRLMELAQEEIIYSTMDFRTDQSGMDVLSCLNHAAERGVQVRLIVDGLSSRSLLHSDALKALAANPNVTVKAYNAIDLLRPWTIPLRLHDKYIIVDDSVYLLGGRNTNDLFLGEYGNSRKNNDQELLVYAPQPQDADSLCQLRSYFDTVWNLSESETIHAGKPVQWNTARADLRTHYLALQEQYPDAFEPVDLAAFTLPANRITLLSNPPEAVNKQPELWDALNALMQTGDTVVIQTPYLICSSDMREDLQALSEQTQVTVVTNSVETGANPWGCAEYLSKRDTFQKMGLQVCEVVSDRAYHTKCILIDDRMSIVGSFNFDMRSCYLDTELMLAVDSPALNSKLQQTVQSAAAHSRIVQSGCVEYGSAYEEVSPPVYQRLLYQLLRFLIPPFRHLL